VIDIPESHQAAQSHQPAQSHQVPQSHRDLLDAKYAALATIGPDGRPQVTGVWFLFEDGKIAISLNTTRKKVRNLRRNPACTVFILDLNNPLRYLEVRGDARLVPDDDYEFAGRLGAKYGADIRTFDPPDQTRVMVVVEPVQVNAVDISR
jgi:PPOX class probable F420-dependent enzyme